MEENLSWLERPVPPGRLIPFLVASTVISLFITVTSVAIITGLGFELPRRSDDSLLITLFIVPTLIFDAWLEEMIFRFIPLCLIFLTKSKSLTILVAIISSVIFGWLHGTFVNVFVQGIVGFWLCIVFIKGSGYGDQRLRGLFCSTFVHAANNLFLVMWAWVLGATFV